MRQEARLARKIRTAWTIEMDGSMSKEKEKKDKKDKKDKKKEKKDKKNKEEKAEKEKKKKKKKDKNKGKQEKGSFSLIEASAEAEPEDEITDDDGAEAVIDPEIADDREIMVSVLVISYNQEKYIEKALKSIVKQKVNFRYEILVGDDASTDGTPKIIRKYAKKYPHLFRVFCREKNLGAAQNFLNIAMESRGKYVTGVEGDDFWCDKYKLQRQVEFLEEHPEYGSCATSFYYVDANNQIIPDEYIPLWMKQDMSYASEIIEPTVYTLDDYNECRLPSHSSTMVSHNVFLKPYAKKCFDTRRDAADQTVVLLILKEGNVYVMPEKTLCYRWIMGNTNSFMSRLNNHEFYPYEWFQYLMTIRKLAKKHLNMNVTLEKYVRGAIFHMVDRFFHYPTKGRWSALWGMMRMADRKGHIFWTFVQAIYLALSYPVVRNMYPLEKESEYYRKINRTWSDFRKDLKGKKLVVYGAGGGCYDLLNEYYDSLAVDMLVDSNENRWNTWFVGYMIKDDSNLWKMDRNNTVVLITTGYYYKDIIAKLERHGFRHYYVYPIMERKKWRNKPLDWMQGYISEIRTW